MARFARSCLALAALLLAAPAGAVLSAARQQLVVQASLSSPETEDFFGDPLAIGDFDCDGFDDLAVGTPEEDYVDVLNSGAVSVHYGGPAGLGNDIDGFTQSMDTVPGDASIANRFGTAVAAGDFDFDTCDDLAIGSYTTVGAGNQAGTVTVLYGSLGGLNAGALGQVWSQATFGVPGTAGDGEFFGSALATGRFNGDIYDDLAVGTAFDNEAGSHAGSLTVIFGSPDGLSVDEPEDDPAVLFTGDNLDCEGADDDENLGHALAAGDFNNDGEDDLAIGVPRESHFPGGVIVANAGAVIVLPGSPTGPSPGSSFCLWAGGGLGGGNIPGTRQTNGYFGEALAAGDFNRDIFAGLFHGDLAIGHKGADHGGVDYAGEVVVLHGSATGLDAVGAELIRTADISPLPPLYFSPVFGHRLAAATVSGGGSEDLLVNAHFNPGWGSVLVPGSPTGLLTGKALAFVSSDPRLLIAPAEVSDEFGAAMAAGDFDSDGFGDVAFGARGEDVGGTADAGAILVLYGVLFADGFETHDTRAWSGVVP